LARIHPDILQKLMNKLGVAEARAYALVAQKAGTTHLSRHLAALVLAAENGININKKAYASEEERAQLRSAGGNQPLVGASVPATIGVAPAIRRGEGLRKPARTTQVSRKSNGVLVVHGRNLALRDAMFGFLRSLGLQPMEWTAAIRETKKATPYVGEVLTTMFRQAAAVVVLLSPDDEARLKIKFRRTSDPAYERRLTGQPRPNVLFEAGRALGSHPDSTILVQVGDVRPFSDTLGMHLVRLAETPECRRDLAGRLETAGCAVNLNGTDWLSTGDFHITGNRPRRRGQRAALHRVAADGASRRR